MMLVEESPFLQRSRKSNRGWIVVMFEFLTNTCVRKVEAPYKMILVEIMRKEDRVSRAVFNRWRWRGLSKRKQRCSSARLGSLLLWWISAILVLGITSSGFDFCQPVTAFTTSSIPSIHRKRINSKHSINSNGEGHDDDTVATSLQTSPNSPLSNTIRVAYALCSSPVLSLRSWKEQVQKGYDRRVNADPSFLGKSITEVLVAAGTQLMAEWNRRGASRMIHEVDFVVPAVLTAVFGKYYR